MGAHQQRAALVFDRTGDGRADRRQRVALGRDQVRVVALARAHDAGLHALPEQHAVVRRLTPAARVERRLVEHDARLGIGREHRALPLAQGRIGKIETVGTTVMRDTHRVTLAPPRTLTG
jgi:hypothetical protein